MSSKKLQGNADFDCESSFVRLRNDVDETLRYGWAAAQGLRPTMEDAVCVDKATFGGESVAFFGVFDGHGGPSMSRIASESLLDFVLKAFYTARGSRNADDESSDSSVASLESEYPSGDELAAALYNGFIEFDQEYMEKRWSTQSKKNAEKSGTTATVALVSSTHIIVANLGDSRTMIVSEGEISFKTQDHKTDSPVELERIQAAGGFVKDNRVNGVLALTRTFGDFEFKQDDSKPAHEQIVSCVPDVSITERGSGDQYMVLACDGLWDVATCEKARSWFDSFFEAGYGYGISCDFAIQKALKRNTNDNVSILTVGFSGVPGRPGTATPEMTSVSCDKYFISMWDACVHAYLPRVMAILEAGYDIDASTYESTTESARAASEHVKETIAQLNPALEQDRYGWTCLMAAAMSGHTSVLKLLLKQGADPNFYTSKSKTTALMLAAVSGHQKSIKVLIDARARKSKKNSSGKTYLELLEDHGHGDILSELKRISGSSSSSRRSRRLSSRLH